MTKEINPEWKNAEYAEVFLYDKESGLENQEGFRRYKLKDGAVAGPDGLYQEEDFIEVPKFIKTQTD